MLTAAQQTARDKKLKALGTSKAYPCIVGAADCFCRWKKQAGYFAGVPGGSSRSSATCSSAAAAAAARGASLHCPALPSQSQTSLTRSLVRRPQTTTRL